MISALGIGSRRITEHSQVGHRETAWDVRLGLGSHNFRCRDAAAFLEQPLLGWSVQRDGRGGLGIVNLRIVEFPADGIPAHQVCVVGFENVANCVEVSYVRIEFRNAGVVVTVSDRALSVRVAMLMSLAQE